MINCTNCQRHHDFAFNTKEQMYLEIPFNAVTGEGKEKVIRSVIDTKKELFNAALQKVQNFNVDIMAFDKFKSKYETSSSFHKKVVWRQKCEIKVEELAMLQAIEKLYPSSHTQEIEVNPNDEDVVNFKVVYPSSYHTGFTKYVATYSYNNITGRCPTGMWIDLNYLSAKKDYEKAVINELKAMQGQEDCIIS